MRQIEKLAPDTARLEKQLEKAIADRRQTVEHGQGEGISASDSDSPAARFCHECGAHIQPDDKFCAQCGTALRRREVSEAA
jgi:hypothetical protein